MVDANSNGKYEKSIDVLDYADRVGFTVKCVNPANGNTCGVVQSAIASGVKEQNFNKQDTAFAATDILSENANKKGKLYVVKKGKLQEGMPYDTDPSGTQEQLTFTAGTVLSSRTAIWTPDLVGGDYDLVLDLGQGLNPDGIYNSSVDIVDADGFSVLGLVEQVKFAIDSSNTLHAVGIQISKNSLGQETSKLVYGYALGSQKYTVDREHADMYDWSTDNTVKWKVLREGFGSKYRSPDIAVDSKGNPFLIVEIHPTGFQWLIFMALNGTTGTAKMDFGKRIGDDDPNYVDVVIYYWDDFWDPQLTNPRIEIDPTNDMPVILSKVFMQFPETFYFQEIYPVAAFTIQSVFFPHPLVPETTTLDIKGTPAVYFGDSLQVGTFAREEISGGVILRHGNVHWPWKWDIPDAVSGEPSRTSRSYQYALDEETKVMADVATASPRRGSWRWMPVDEVKGLSDDIGNGDLAIDENGDIHVAYYRNLNKYQGGTSTPSPSRIFYAKLQNIPVAGPAGYPQTAVGKYSMPVMVSSDDTLSIHYTPGIDVDKYGRVHLAYPTQTDIQYAQFESAYTNAGDYYQTEITNLKIIDVAPLTNIGQNMRPSVAVTENGPNIAFRDLDGINSSDNAGYFVRNIGPLDNPIFDDPVQILKPSDYAVNPAFNHILLERNKWSKTMRPELYLGFTHILDGEMTFQYIKTLPHMTFLIVLDGMDSIKFNQQLSNGNLPNIKKLMTDYTSLKATAKSIYPQLTFPAYASMLTGLLPKDHGVPGDSFKASGTVIDLKADPNKINAHLTTAGTETLFDVLATNGRTMASLEAPITKGIPTGDPNKNTPISATFASGTINNFNDLTNYLLDIDAYDDQSDNDPVDFVSVYLLSQDHGLATTTGSMSYTDADAKVGQIIDALKAVNGLEQSVFLITSDHGFADVSGSASRLIQDIHSSSKTFTTQNNGYLAYYYLAAGATDADIVAAGKDIQEHDTIIATSNVLGKLDKIYVKQGTEYKNLVGGIVSGTAPVNFANLFSQYSGDVIITPEASFYFADSQHKAVEKTYTNIVPFIITGNFYRTILEGTLQLTAPVEQIDVAKTLAYLVGGPNVADSVGGDGKSIFDPEFSVIVGSPVFVHLYDSQGNHVGKLPNGDIEISIPLSTYHLDNKTKKIKIDVLQQVDDYKIVIDAFDTGNFTLKLRKNTRNESLAIDFPTINIKEGSIAVVDMISFDDFILKFDYDGDNNFETSVNPQANINSQFAGGKLTITINAMQGDKLDIDLLDQYGIRIQGTALNDIINGVVVLSKTVDTSYGGLGFLPVDEVINVSSPNGVESLLVNLNISLKYNTALLKHADKDTLQIYKISGGIPSVVPGAVLRQNFNMFENLDSFGLYIAGAGDQNPIINGIDIVPEISNVANSLFLVKANVTDNMAVQSVVAKYLGNNYSMALNVGTGFYEAILQAPALDGVYGISLLATDNNNNTAFASYSSFKLDTTPPVVNITSPKDNSIIKDNLALVKFIVNENIINATYVLDLNPEAPAGVEGFEIAPGFGKHNLTVNVLDLALNPSSTAISFEIPIDNIEVSELEMPYAAKLGQEIEVAFVSRNTGNGSETVTYLLYDNSTFIASQIINVSSNATITSKFDYQPAMGVHNLSVVASPVPGETYLADNKLMQQIKVSDKSIILVVSDGASPSAAQKYLQAIQQAGYDHVFFDTSKTTLSEKLINDFRLVLWYTGDSADTINGIEAEALQNYLGNGGRLFVSGRAIGKDIDGTDFYSSALGAKFIKPVDDLRNIVGIYQDPVSRGLLVDISSGGEEIEALPAANDSQVGMIFTYIGAGGAALRKTDADSKAVYFAFAFEDINSTGDRNVIMSRLIADFGIDDSPPQIVNMTPADNSRFPVNTSFFTLRLETDETSACAISEQKGLRFSLMQPFDSQDGLVHYINISNLSNNVAYTRNIKCKDTKNNIAIIDYNFSVHNRTFNIPVLLPVSDRTVNESSSIQILIDVSDPEGDPVQLYLKDLPSINFPKPIANRFVKLNTTFTLNTNYDDAGQYKLQVIAGDGSGNATADFVLYVLDVNRPPVLNFIPPITAKVGNYMYRNITATDPDGDALLYYDSSDMFSINLYTGGIVFKPKAEQSGNYTINFTVSDGEYADNQLVPLEISSTNRAPIMQFIPTKTAIQGTLFTHTVNATDPDGDLLNFSSNSSLFNISSTGLVSFTPASTDVSTHIISIHASDGALSSSRILNLLIYPTNSAPKILNIFRPLFAFPGDQVNITVEACDPELDPLCT